MSLFEILTKEYDLVVNPVERFELADLLKYFEEEDDRYKHIRGVASQMQALIKQLYLGEEDAQKLMKIAYVHDIGYSKRVKSRGFHPLDGAIFSLEKAFGEDVALAVMFHTKAYGEAKLMGGKTLEVYQKAKELLDKNEKAKHYVDLITYCDLITEKSGEPTTANRRIFKILARNEKNSIVYKNIKANKRSLLRLEKRIRLSTVKEKTILQKVLDGIQGK